MEKEYKVSIIKIIVSVVLIIILVLGIYFLFFKKDNLKTIF